jgi:hypothetical protein
MSRSMPFISLQCREKGCRERKKETMIRGEGKKKRVRDRERGVESESIGGIFHGLCQALGHCLTLYLALCCGLGHGLHQGLGHCLNLDLSLCCGLGNGLILYKGLNIGHHHIYRPFFGYFLLNLAASTVILQ